MKRKVYTTTRERKADQIKGFWACPIVNVPLWLISQTMATAPLPWLVNGVVLALAFVFRPQFGVGYVAFIAIATAVVTVFGVVFVAACFVSLLSAAVIGNLAIALFAVLMLGGLYYLALFARSLFRAWQSSHENTSHEGGGNKN